MIHRKVIEMVDSGVPPLIALQSAGVEENELTDDFKKVLYKRHNQVRAKMLASLFATTQRSSANPSSIAQAAKTWFELSAENQVISKKISEYSDDELLKMLGENNEK